MNHLKASFVVVISLCVLTACASKGIDISSEKQLEIKKEHSYRGKIRNIKVLKNEKQLKITGLVINKSIRRNLKGHVHIDVYDQYNSIQQSIDSDYRFRRTGLRKAKTARFQAELAMMPEQNGRIVVTHHDAKSRVEPARALPDSPAAGEGMLIIE